MATIVDALVIQIKTFFDPKGINAANKSVNILTSNFNGLNNVNFARSLVQIEKLRRAVNVLKFAVSSVAQLYAKVYEIGGNAEKYKLTFENMFGGAEGAAEMMHKLNAEAIKLPSTVPEIRKASVMLKAMGVSAAEIIPNIRMMSDVVAGLPNLTMERLALNLGQVRAATYLRGIELRDFTSAGIPILDMLGKLEKFKNFSGEGIREAISRRAVSYSDVMQVFKMMTSEGGDFYKLSEKVMSTVPGQWSNFMDKIYLSFEKVYNIIQKHTVKLLEEVSGYMESSDDIPSTLATILDLGLDLLSAAKYLFKTIKFIYDWASAFLGTIGLSVDKAIKLYLSFVLINRSSKILAGIFGGLLTTGTRLFNVVDQTGQVVRGLSADEIFPNIMNGIKGLLLGIGKTILILAPLLIMLLIAEDVFRFITDPNNYDSMIGRLETTRGVLGDIVRGYLAIGRAIAGVFLPADQQQAMQRITDETEETGRDKYGITAGRGLGTTLPTQSLTPEVKKVLDAQTTKADKLKVLDYYFGTESPGFRRLAQDYVGLSSKELTEVLDASIDAQVAGRNTPEYRKASGWHGYDDPATEEEIRRSEVNKLRHKLNSQAFDRVYNKRNTPNATGVSTDNGDAWSLDADVSKSSSSAIKGKTGASIINNNITIKGAIGATEIENALRLIAVDPLRAMG